jgi:hypothetical protein
MLYPLAAAADPYSGYNVGRAASRELKLLPLYGAADRSGLCGRDKSTEEFQRYIQGLEFPASKGEVASVAQSNGIPQNIVQKIRNANKERFDDRLQAVQAMGGHV